jgi:hypothetical protein
VDHSDIIRQAKTQHQTRSLWPGMENPDLL